ncbi:unnamed protein product [Paramecium primaurelia]|uniref:Uncharacterized protein n=1 Tax=Paramecium primaurelia TaxID=5886 RepID=A0A8S1KS82_PARPR|nr:unnamed protein product [Paramecium primaurelia]
MKIKNYKSRNKIKNKKKQINKTQLNIRLAGKVIKSININVYIIQQYQIKQRKQQLYDLLNQALKNLMNQKIHKKFNHWQKHLILYHFCIHQKQKAYVCAKIVFFSFFDKCLVFLREWISHYKLKTDYPKNSESQQSFHLLTKLRMRKRY